MATTLERLRERGPVGPAFWRYGRKRLEPLRDAIGNPRRDAYLTRRRQEEQRREEERAAEREAARPACADCGAKFTDDRWRAVGYSHRPESHKHLCEDCQSRAVAAKKQAEADERERQEQEQLRQQAEVEAPAQKAGRWRPRFRT
ncbi:hypothetical protein ACIO6T_43545 [Streptomyces sp. NPDC087532]|uniref:hypothetical protein n=1 Tax=Streptomyces sp. NPDC087532 TaxID=3365795 RepID=UPI003813536F